MSWPNYTLVGYIIDIYLLNTLSLTPNNVGGAICLLEMSKDLKAKHSSAKHLYYTNPCYGVETSIKK